MRVSDDKLQVLLTLQMLISSRDWMHSREETITWRNAAIVDREIRIDFSLPESVQSVAEDQSYCYVPLTVIRKNHESTSLIVYDEAGNRVPALSATESMRYAAEIMVAVLEQIADEPSVDDLVARRNLVNEIAFADSDEANLALRRLGDLTDGKGLKGEGGLLWSIASSFVDSFPLMVEIPAGNRGHRSFTFRTSVPMHRMRIGMSAILRTLGWTASSLWIDLPNLGRSQSYEVIVNAPEGAEISLARLIAWDASSASKVHTKKEFLGPGRLPFVRLGVVDIPPSSSALLAVDLAPNRSYSAGVLVTSLLAAIMLTVGWHQLGTVMTSSDAATTLLLAGPTLFSALVAQPGRGFLGAQFLIAARAVLLLVGLLTFMAAGTLVTIDSYSLLGTLWLILALLAWLCSAVLFVGVVSPGVDWRAAKARRQGSGLAATQ